MTSNWLPCSLFECARMEREDGFQLRKKKTKRETRRARKRKRTNTNHKRPSTALIGGNSICSIQFAECGASLLSFSSSFSIFIDLRARFHRLVFTRSSSFHFLVISCLLLLRGSMFGRWIRFLGLHIRFQVNIAGFSN